MRRAARQGRSDLPRNMADVSALLAEVRQHGIARVIYTSSGGVFGPEDGNTPRPTTHYGAFRAVRDVSLVIEPHAVTAIIGPSGSGKSTVLRAINRLHEVNPSARVKKRIASS